MRFLWPHSESKWKRKKGKHKWNLYLFVSRSFVRAILLIAFLPVESMRGHRPTILCSCVHRPSRLNGFCSFSFFSVRDERNGFEARAQQTHSPTRSRWPVIWTFHIIICVLGTMCRHSKWPRAAVETTHIFKCSNFWPYSQFSVKCQEALRSNRLYHVTNTLTVILLKWARTSHRKFGFSSSAHFDLGHFISTNFSLLTSFIYLGIDEFTFLFEDSKMFFSHAHSQICTRLHKNSRFLCTYVRITWVSAINIANSDD